MVHSVVQLAEAFLKAVEERDVFAIQRGIDLAEATLKAAEPADEDDVGTGS